MPEGKPRSKAGVAQALLRARPLRQFADDLERDIAGTGYT